jgi:hypothetical protein
MKDGGDGRWIGARSGAVKEKSRMHVATGVAHMQSGRNLTGEEGTLHPGRQKFSLPMLLF